VEEVISIFVAESTGEECVPPQALEIVQRNLLINKNHQGIHCLSSTCEIKAEVPCVTTNHEMIHHERQIHVAESAREQCVQPPASVHVQPNLPINKKSTLACKESNQNSFG
jgi:hypothetical protein